MTRRTAFASIVALLLLIPASGCAKRHYISWADVTLRNYRDFPGLKISASEWRRSAEIFSKSRSDDRQRSEAKKLFCKAKALQAEGLNERALALFEKALEADPGLPLSYQAIGSIRLSAGDFAEAKAMFERAYELDPMWISPLSDLGVTYYHLGRPLAALQSFDKAITIDCSQGYLHSNRGNILTTLGRYDEAVKAHLEAVNLESRNPIFYMNLAATLEEKGDLENQLWVQQKLKDLLPEEHKAACMLKIARLYDAMGRNEEALAEYRKAVELRPGEAFLENEMKKYLLSHGIYAHLIDFIVEKSDRPCKQCAQECYDIGNLLLRENNLAGALKSYKAAIELYPEWTEPCHNMGIAYYKKHDYEKALELFGRVLEESPGDVSASLNTGMAYYRMGEAEKAIEWTRKVLDSREDLAVAHSNLGEILRHQGKYKKADKELEQAVRLDPESCYVFSRLAGLLVETGRLEEAHERMAGFGGSCASLHSVKAMLLVKKKKHDEALEEIDQALSMDELLAEAHAVRSLVLFKQGKKGEARKELMTAACMEARILEEKPLRPLLKKLKISKCGE